METLLGTLYSLDQVNNVAIYWKGRDVTTFMFPNFSTERMVKKRFRYSCWGADLGRKHVYNHTYIMPYFDVTKNNIKGFFPQSYQVEKPLSADSLIYNFFTLQGDYMDRKLGVGSKETAVDLSNDSLNIILSSDRVTDENIPGVIESLLRSIRLNFPKEYDALKKITLVNKNTSTEYAANLTQKKQ